MPQDTMGADGAFDRRRQELAILRGCEKGQVSDADVVQSYRDECDPAKPEGNFMLQYLQRAQLGYVFGQTLFVHDGLSASTVGAVPSVPAVERRVIPWVQKLNAWARKEVAAFVSDPYAGKNSRSRKGAGLTDYGVDGGNGGATVVYNSFLDNGNGKPLDKAVQQFLLDSGIVTVVSGHQPHGDCPLVMKTGQTTVITADTSYSQMGANSWWGPDNRGDKAVSEVLVYPDGSSRVHGCLADGSMIDYTLREGVGDEFVGRQLANGSWVKARTVSGDYVLCLGEGYRLTVTRQTEAQMAALTPADFMPSLLMAEPTRPAGATKAELDAAAAPLAPSSAAGLVAAGLAAADADKEGTGAPITGAADQVSAAPAAHPGHRLHPKTVAAAASLDKALARQLKALRGEDKRMLEGELKKVKVSQAEASERLTRAAGREAAVAARESAVTRREQLAKEAEAALRARELEVAEREARVQALHVHTMKQSNELAEAAKAIGVQKAAVQHREEVLQVRAAHVQQLQTLAAKCLEQNNQEPAPPGCAPVPSQQQHALPAGRKGGCRRAAGGGGGRERELEGVAVVLQAERDRYFGQLQTVERLVDEFETLPNVPAALLEALRSALYP